MGKAQGGAWASQVGAAFSNPFTIELARDCENTSLTRFASGPAFRALREMIGIWETKIQGCDWLARRGDVLRKHPQACLRVSFENGSGIRVANQPWVFRGQIG
jgi:hypothetical protein